MWFNPFLVEMFNNPCDENTMLTFQPSALCQSNSCWTFADQLLNGCSSVAKNLLISCSSVALQLRFSCSVAQLLINCLTFTQHHSCSAVAYQLLNSCSSICPSVAHQFHIRYWAVAYQPCISWQQRLNISVLISCDAL